MWEVHNYAKSGIREGRDGAAYTDDAEKNTKLTFPITRPSKQTGSSDADSSSAESTSGAGSFVSDGLEYSPIFDGAYYLSLYPDLQRAFGTDQNKAFKHFLRSGLREGRSGKATFSVYAYANRYPDLQKAFGTDVSKYARHYLRSGIREKRDGSPFTGEKACLNTRFAFVSETAGGSSASGSSASNAVVTAGSLVYNGVDYSPVFDARYYLNTYADLRKAFGNDESRAFSHFIRSGMREGRRGNAAFNVFAYANRYKDLFNAFGADYASYYRHYCRSGIREGRNGSGSDSGLNVPVNYIQHQDLGNGRHKITIINPQGGASLTSVEFDTWSLQRGQNDLSQEQGTRSGGSWTYTVNTRSHGNSGDFQTDVYGVIGGSRIKLGSVNYEGGYISHPTVEQVISWCKSTPTPGPYLCSEWVSDVFQKGGYPYYADDADVMFYKYCDDSNLANLKPGMVIAVPTHDKSYMGGLYGHVAIYIGNGKVMDNVGRIRTSDLSWWIDYYDGKVTPKFGWYQGVSVTQ